MTPEEKEREILRRIAEEMRLKYGVVELLEAHILMEVIYINLN